MTLSKVSGKGRRGFVAFVTVEVQAGGRRNGACGGGKSVFG